MTGNQAEGPLRQFGTLVLRARRMRGWTLRDLAAASGVGLNSCSRIERGMETYLSSALKLAGTLGINLGALAAPAVNGDSPAAAIQPEAKPGRLARVEVKGFRDLGIVRVSEATLAGEPMLHAECDDGSAADFPPSSLHFITWLPEGAAAEARAAIGPPRAMGVAVDGWESAEDAAYDADEEDPF
jgi:transcriptional regulator with XRE-family HTH domain